MKAVDQLASDLRAIETGPLKVTRLGHFIALCPSGDEMNLMPLPRLLSRLGCIAPTEPSRRFGPPSCQGLDQTARCLVTGMGLSLCFGGISFSSYPDRSRVAGSNSPTKHSFISVFCQRNPRPFSLKSVALFGDPGMGNPFVCYGAFPSTVSPTQSAFQWF